MNKKIILTTISLLILITLFAVNVSAQEFNVSTHNINISSDDQKVTITENMVIKEDEEGIFNNITFWSPVSSADKITMLVNNNPVQVQLKEGNTNTYISDIQSLNIDKTQSTSITIEYQLEKDIKNYEKVILQNTSQINIVFNEETIFTGKNLQKFNEINLKLFTPYESLIGTYIIVGIVLFIVLLIVFIIYSKKKQTKTKTKKTEGLSEELLETKRTLLMSILKDIEKKHRMKQISDETYHKLKDQYKNDAVEAMRKLDNIKTKK